MVIQEFVSEREKIEVDERFASEVFNVGEAKLQVIVYPNGTPNFPGPPRYGISNNSDQDVVLEKVKITLGNLLVFEKGLKIVKANMTKSWGFNAEENYFKNLKDGRLEVKIEVEIKGDLTILGVRLYNIRHFSLKTFGLMPFTVIPTHIMSPIKGFFSRPTPIGGP